MFVRLYNNLCVATVLASELEIDNIIDIIDYNIYDNMQFVHHYQ